MSASHKERLARIRDNQRRSRARRREYLQELEGRFQQCALRGIEASPEIQVAARKVVNENRMLRALLAEHGVGDDSIEQSLQSCLAARPDLLLEGQPGAPGSVGAAYHLEHLLYPHIHNYGYQSAEVPTTIIGSECHSGDHIVQSLWELTQLTPNEHARRQYEDVYTVIQTASSSHQLMTPGITGTGANSEILGHDSGRGVQQQRLGPVAPSGSTIAASKLSRQDPQMFDFNTPLKQSGQTAYSGDRGTTIYALATNTPCVEAGPGYLINKDTNVNQ